MRILLDHDRATLLQGDCRDLSMLPDNSVDAVICDPPYLLTNASGTGFMGREWDSLKVEKGETIGTAAERWHRSWAKEALRVLKPGGHCLSFGGSRTAHRMMSALEDVGFELRDVIMWGYSTGFPKSLDVAKQIDKSERRRRALTVPYTEAAQKWEGWGTALKPAYEPCAMARKPLVDTVAANVLEYGTGAINVGACRIGTDIVGGGGAFGGGWSEGSGLSKTYEARPVVGRWPANVIFDEGTGAFIDEFSGKSVSQYFYCPKPSKSEKEAGLDHLPIVSGADITGREEGSAGIQNPRAGAGAKGGSRNTHVTVKAVELMRYLCRLVTPPGGVVLDVFAGSGTTGVAALAEGFSFIGVELGGDDGSHLPILIGRIRHALGLPPEIAGTETPPGA